MKKGSIELARRLCVEIAGEPDEDDSEGLGYGSVDVAEILSAEIVNLREIIFQIKKWDISQYSKNGHFILPVNIREKIQNSMK